MQPTPVGSERSLDTRSKLFAGGQLELGRALSAAFNVSVAERLKVARKSWRVDAFRANVRHMSFPGHLLTLSSPFRTRCWIQRSRLPNVALVPGLLGRQYRWQQLRRCTGLAWYG